MQKRIVLVLDCGATNVRTIAVNENGNLLANSCLPNNTQFDPNYPEYKIWDIHEIWNKLCDTTKNVLTQINKNEVKRELSDSKIIIEEKIQKKVNFLSYPNGNHNNAIINVAKIVGYEACFCLFPATYDLWY